MQVRRSGVTYGGELEHRLAAAWGHYRWEQFQALDGEDQSAVVAAYRASNQIEAVIAENARRESGKK